MSEETGFRAEDEGPKAWRAQAEAALADGHTGLARDALTRLWALDPSSATAGFVVSRFTSIRASLHLVPCRVFVLRSFTVEPAIPLLRAMAFCAGIDLTVGLGDFNVFEQAILDPEGPLHAFRPDVVLVASQTRDVTPALWSRFADLAPGDVDAEVLAASERVAGWVRQLRARTTASIVVHGLESPERAALGLLDASGEAGQIDAIARVNRAIREASRAERGAYVLDTDALVARRGRDGWYDPKKWLTARMPIAAAELVHLARAWMRFLHPLTGRVAKVLVCDLDHTLWGGVVGEDGAQGVRIGHEHPGAAHLELQRAILDVARRGVVLAICSKNNLADAMEVFDKRPEMLLKPGDFAAIRVNWVDKAENLRSIARELDVGLDALAFLDDHPAERQGVRVQLPDVWVVDLPADPARYARALRDSPFLERLATSTEDRERGRYYEDERRRTELETQAASVEDFYASLAQRAAVEPAHAGTIARIAQLTQKTNQFNVTTRRYTEAAIEALARSADHDVLSVRVRDRFGDSGLVGVAIVDHRGDDAVIEALLLSCRVIGRSVETALLSALVDRARERGKGAIVGHFIPTAKNAPAENFYAAHGFVCTHASQDGASEWRLSPSQRVPYPVWITPDLGEP